MDPFVPTNRKSRAMLYGKAATANARASNRLAAELKTLEKQKHRETVKLHNSKFRIKTALSMRSLYGGHNNGGNLNVPISPRAPPSSVPLSPVTSPRMSRRRNSEVLTPSTRSLQSKGYQSKDNNGNCLSRTNLEGELHNDKEYESYSFYTVKDLNYTDTRSPRPSRRSFSGFEQDGNPGMALKGQKLILPKNRRSKTTLLANRSRKLSTPLVAIHENRDNLDQKIKTFHESLLAYKRDEDKDEEVFDEGDKDNEVISDSVPKLRDIKPNTLRTNSLPCLVPRLSLSNLTLKSSVGKDDSLENLKKCRYLRIPDAGELSVGEVFSREEEEEED